LANWLIIGVIIGFFVWQINQVNTYHTNVERELSKNINTTGFKIKTDLFDGLVLDGWTTRGLLGHMWLHGGWLHLIGNLLFLWIFGNAVCAKIGQVPFIILYLIFGIAAGAAHLIFNGGPVIGASGAINGVVGMYLVFFPTNSISCFFLMVFPLIYRKTFEVSSYVMILMWLAYDIFWAVIGGGHIAHFAHLGGFAAGVAIATLLLQTKLIKMSRYEKSIFQIFSDRRIKPERKELFAHRILKRDYPTEDKTQQAEEGKSDTEVEQFVSVSNESSMKAGTVAKDGFIRFYCTCGKRCKIPAKFAGRTGKCPGCKQSVRIPSA
jgi:membrane associated rhomboid family serine protease